MFTNFAKVLANKSIFNARKPVLLKSCLIRTNPVDFSYYEDTLDNRVISGYQSQRKIELLRHWTQLVRSFNQECSFGKVLEKMQQNYQTYDQNELKRAIELRQFNLKTMNFESLTNLIYLTKVSGIKDDKFDSELMAAISTHDLKDASPSNLADILYYFGKTEREDETEKQFLKKVLEAANSQLQNAPMFVRLNGNRTMLYEEYPDGATSGIEADVALLVQGQGKAAGKLAFRYGLHMPLKAFMTRMLIRRANPKLDLVSISVLSDLQRLQSFTKAFGHK